jgi:hypothetical protein
MGSMKSIVNSNDTQMLIQIRDNIDEHCDDILLEITNQITKDNVLFECKEMRMINSYGSSKWVKFIRNVKEVSKTIEFHSCSYEFMIYANMLTDFFGGGKIHSFHVPFYCESCSLENMVLINTTDIDSEGEFPSSRCSKCQSEIFSEVDAEDFTGCLSGV